MSILALPLTVWGLRCAQVMYALAGELDGVHVVFVIGDSATLESDRRPLGTPI